MPLLGQAVAHAGAGRRDLARAAYDRLSPAKGWAAPESLWLQMHAIRVHLATRLGVLDDIPALLAALEPHRGRTIASGGGTVGYDGPVELWLGVGAAALGDFDAADRDLAAAGQFARRSGTPGFAVHVDMERSTVRSRA